MESIYQKRKKKVQLPWALFQPSEKNMKQKCLWLVCRNNTPNVALSKFGGLIYFSSSKLRRYCKDFDTAFFARAFPAHWWRIRFLSVTSSASPSAWDLLILRWHRAQSWFTGSVWSHTHTCQYWPSIKSQPVALPVFTPFLSSRLKS